MGTAKVDEMRRKVQAELEKMYGDGEPAPSCTAQEVEDRGFLLQEHARGLCKVCKENGYSVSFREAGEATLKRIRKGHPCKGHEILDKTVKQKGAGVWTYEASADILTELSGLVGYKTPGSGCLAGLWVESGNRATQVPLEKLTGDVVRHAYTGDYDMHDLLRLNGERCERILADTPEENSAIDRLNHGMMRAVEDGRYEKVAELEKSGQRSKVSAYSPIRHGAQTSFMSFLLGIAGGRELLECLRNQKPEDVVKVPHQDTIMNISCSICMFDAQGRIFILDSPKKIYWYYNSRNLLEQIPFYYFFKDLAGSGLPVPEYATVLNHYLRGFCGIE